MDLKTSYIKPEVNITDLYLKLKETHRNVFIHQFGDLVFLYTSIGRKDYRTIIENEDLDDFQKENVICDICTLHPRNVDWNTIDAGIPEKLAEEIIKNSFLDSIESRQKLLAYYRSEMYDLDNQISCLINEFPQFDLEEIETWGVEKTTKYLSRAEWKLHNLRGLQFVEPEGSFGGQKQTTTQETPPSPRSQQQQQRVNNDRNRTSQETIRGQDKRASKLTPEKIKQMQEFAAKFPEIDVFGDSGFKGIDGFQGDNVDVTPPALRVPR